MTAARVNLVVDQGADFLAQFFWMDQSDTPIRVEPPLRMEVYTSDTRQIQMALQAGEMEEDNSYDIVYNSDNGMIQILISAERTLNLPAAPTSTTCSWGTPTTPPKKSVVIDSSKAPLK